MTENTLILLVSLSLALFCSYVTYNIIKYRVPLWTSETKVTTSIVRLYYWSSALAFPLVALVSFVYFFSELFDLFQ